MGQSMKVEDWLGADNALGIKIWHTKYQQNDETFDDWVDRVSGGDKKVKKLILDKKFLFGGRILSNRGLNTGSLSNCYCLSVEDSIQSIYKTASDMAQTYKAGGGVGVDIGNLAPNGAKVNNPAKTSSGAVSFIDLFTTTTGLIGQNGRRGALMVSMPCTHPDIDEFIRLKTDVNKATTANLSIRVFDDFMNAVEHGDTWKTSFTRKETGETIEKEYDAKELFKQFCDANYDYGEPGMIFWDSVCKNNMLNAYPNFKFSGLNPCLTGDTDLSIIEDNVPVHKPICELEGREDITVIAHDGTVSHNNKVWSNGIKDIVRVRTSIGTEIKCTPDHRFMLIDGTECMAKDLKGKRIMPFHARFREFDREYMLMGFIQGDGQTTRLKSKTHKGIEVNIGEKDKDIYSLLEGEKFTISGDERHIYLSDWNDRLREYGFSENALPSRRLPAGFENDTLENQLSFMRGLFSANGCVVSGARVQFKTTCRELVSDIESFFKSIGIKCYHTTNKPKDITFANGEYRCKESYDICISDALSIKSFHQNIGFVHKYKEKALLDLVLQKSGYVTSVTEWGQEEVFDFTENNTHWGVANEYVVHNCSEVPLPEGGACLLGSLNLAEYADWDGTFDFDSFEKDVKTAIRALDDVQSEGIELHPVDIQKKTAKDWKQLGLGIMGLGDALIKMNVVYGSEESITLCDMIATTLAKSAIDESVYLGEERGSFPRFNSKNTNSSSFWREHFPNDDTNYMRNSQLLAIAPTGTISTMLDVSGGIEPLFALEFDRTTKSLDGKDVTYKVSPSVVRIAREKGIVEGLVPSSDIHYKDRIAMQAVWQRHIDGSISSTINLPNNFPKDKIGDVYISAWKAGLKGITVFRDGCKRAGILTVEKKKEHKEYGADELVGKLRKIVTGCGNQHVSLFSTEDGTPRSLFVSRGGSGGCTNTLNGLGRMISLAMKYDIPVEEIIDQLESCGSCPSYTARRATKGDTSPGSCCPSAIGKVLRELTEKKNIKKDKVEYPCPQCGEELAMEGGCHICHNCGYSKCQ